MSETMKQFLTKLAADEALQEALKGAKSPEEAFAIAQGAVAGLDFGEFTQTMNMVKQLTAKGDSSELSDDDLDLVAGGWSSEDTNLTISIVSGVIGAASAAATAAI